MDIVIAANFCRDFSESDNGRFVYLAKMLAEEHDVELITSDFYHGKKKHRESIPTSWPFKITFVHEPGYKKNVSIQRLRSHKRLGKSLTEYLKSRKKPDVIYCAMPSLDFAEAAMKYAKANGVRFIIDIQDLWPEAFKMVLHIPLVSKILFSPMEKKANAVYSQADHIVAVSKTYADRAQAVNATTESTIAFLGTDITVFDGYAGQRVKTNDGTVKLAYIGSLSHSYDLPTVFDAMRQLSMEELSRIKFIVMGDGPLKSTFEEKAQGLPVAFTGLLPYPEMVKRLVQCDFAVNPIVKGSAGSIINKVGDYAMAGLPVINMQECEEYRALIDAYQAGVNCACENVGDVVIAIKTMLDEPSLRKEMGANSRRVGEELFDRRRSYRNIIDMIESCQLPICNKNENTSN